MKKTLNILFFGSLLLSGFSQAAVSIGFNDPFNGGVSSGLANAAGTVSNGLKWGIIVDTAGDGFSTTYQTASPLASGQTAQLSVLGSPSNDWLIIADTLTVNNNTLTEGDLVTTGGPGGVGTVTNILLANGISTGDSFRLVWFDPSNNTAGFLDHSSFVIPNEGFAVDYDDPFVGADPARPALGLVFSVIPEPSTALLGAIGALGLLRRRR